MNRAFTILEIVFVIVVLGILYTIASSSLANDRRQQAIESIYNALQQTRHMALIDNRTNPSDPEWQQELWHIHFAQAKSRENGAKKGYFYTVSSNLNHGANVNKDETAIDPSNGKYYYNRNGDEKINSDESPALFLSKNFGVENIKFSGGCGPSTYIAFDHLGRPYVGGIYKAKELYSQVMLKDCYIEVEFEGDNLERAIFTIEEETGHVSVS